MSREKTRRMFWYQVDDGEAISRHLEKMARKGWLLENVDNLFYTYRRSKPLEVRYTVTFFPDASYFDPGLIEGQKTYVEYCQAAGWELAAFYGPVQYFRTTNPDAPPIETDETVKLTSIRRMMRKSFLPTYILLLLCGACVFLRFPLDPLRIFYSNVQLSRVLLLGGIFLFSLVMLGDYLIWLLRSQYAVEHGGCCKKPHTRFRLAISAAMLALCVMLVIGYMTDDAWIRGIFMFRIAVYIGCMALSRWFLRRLKAGNTQRDAARAAYFGFAIAAALVIGIGSAFLLFRLTDAGIIRTKREPADTYVYASRDGSFVYSQDVYDDPLPITLEDLGYTVKHSDHCSYEENTERSILAVHRQYYQRVLNFESSLPDLDFQTYDSQWPWILEKTWEELIAKDVRRYDPQIMERLDPAPWGALEAYRLEGLTTYYLRYPTRIITFHLSGEATTQQLSAIAQTLCP